MSLLTGLYIDQAAKHDPAVVRALCYAAVEGQQGVFAPSHLAVQQLPGGGPQIQVLGGGWSALCTHAGGDFEAYLGKFGVAEVVNVSAVDASGPRTDLVILRVENPYVAGAGSWDLPADPVNGPYNFIRVIEGVTANIQDVRAWNNTWSAITLARIDRPANTNYVLQSHITDLRSLAKLGGQRVPVINNPPPTPPPVAYDWFTNFHLSAGAAPGADNVHNYFTQDTTWQNWPSVASWQVPIPAWATSMDIEVDVLNAQILTNDIYAQIAVSLGGARTTAQTIAIDYVQVPARSNLAYGVTVAVPTNLRGKVVPFTLQLASYNNAPGRLDAKHGTSSKLQVNFHRAPS